MTPANYLNQYSFVAAAVIVMVAVAIIVWRWRSGPAWARVGLAVLAIAGLAAVRLALNYQENYDGSLASVEAVLNDGDPTLLMLYSNY